LIIIHKISRIARFRKLLINFSFRSIANLFSKAIGLITLPIITRALGPEGYGNFNLIILIVAYTTVPINLLGLRSYGIREIAGNRKSDQYAINILSMQNTVSILAVFISTIITFFIFKENLFLYSMIIIGYLMVFSNASNLEFFYVAKKDLVFPTIARLIGQGVYVVGVISLIKNPNDLPILVFLTVLTSALSILIQLRKFHLNFGKVKLKLNFKETFGTFKKTYKLGISQSLEGLYPSIPQLLIPIFLGTYALGIFAGGYKVYSILMMFYVTLFYAMAPYLVKLNEYPVNLRRKYHLFIFILITFFGLTTGMILYFFGEPILLLILGDKFHESVVVFNVLSLTLIPLTPINMLILNILIFSDNDKYYLYSMLSSIATILISSVFLIQRFGAVGAVYSMAISMFISIIVAFYFYTKTVYKS